MPGADADPGSSRVCRRPCRGAHALPAALRFLLRLSALPAAASPPATRELAEPSKPQARMSSVTSYRPGPAGGKFNENQGTAHLALQRPVRSAPACTHDRRAPRECCCHSSRGSWGKGLGVATARTAAVAQRASCGPAEAPRRPGCVLRFSPSLPPECACAEWRYLPPLLSQRSGRKHLVLARA
jgi:hypothetical protein